MTSRRQVLAEECRRSVAWLAVGVVGWTALVGLGDAFDPILGGTVSRTAAVVGLSLVTWAVVTAPLVAVRLWTGSDLSVLRPGEPFYVATVTVLAGAFVPLALVLEFGVSPLAFPLYGLPASLWFVLAGRRQG